MFVALVQTNAKRVSSRLREHWRPVYSDALSLLVLLCLIVASVRYVPHGMCFNDPSWYFHFGRRLLDGSVPYRDYIFQVGPLPIYVDALFQKLFGSTYLASMWAGLFVKVLRVAAVWAVARRLAGSGVAALLTVFVAFEPVFSFAHHWSTSYAQLFIVLSGLAFIHAAQETKRVNVHLGLAGAFAALVVSARQSSAIMIGVMLFFSSLILLARKVFFTRVRFLALWAGFAIGNVLAFGPLVVSSAAGPAIQQMFLDAPAKKDVSGLPALLDGISGGALVVHLYDPSFAWWGGIAVFLAIPILLVTVVFVLLSREEPISSGTLGLLIVPAAMGMVLLSRYSAFTMLGDMPRTFLTVTSALVVLSPERLRKWCGVDVPTGLGIGTLALASDFAMEMSFPGRGWGDATSLMTGAVLFVLASTRLKSFGKLALCSLLAVAAFSHFAVLTRAGLNPFAKDDSADGTLAENNFSVDHPILRGIKINEPRKKVLEWMRAEIKPGSTCFVYGNLPVLYSLLECKNPTRIDSTAADFVTGADADAAMAALQVSPPEYLIVHEKSWMNPDIEIDLNNDIARYGGMNPKASFALHTGMRKIRDRYEIIAEMRDVLGPDLAKQASIQRDIIDATRVYRLKR